MGFEHRCLVASLPQRPCPAISGVEIRDIVPPDPLHHATQAGFIGRSGKKVDVVRHQYIGMDRHLELPRRLAKPSKESRVVIMIAKDGLPVVADLDDMMKLMRNNESRESSHDSGCAPARQ